MKVGGLFTGGGGFEYAASLMGWEVGFTCEIDSFCQKIIEYYFPKAEHYEDIKKADFKKYRGQIHILTGGFPCQPFSHAGKRKGANDDRYLWPEMLRAIREIKPTWIVGENVGGITSMVQPGNETPVESQASLFEASDTETILEQEYVIETICGDLECEGYSVQPIIIPACAIGAPHRRDRIWIVAYSNSSATGSPRQGTEIKGLRCQNINEPQRGRQQAKQHTGCREFLRPSSNHNKLNGNIPGFCSGKISQHEEDSIWLNTNPTSKGLQKRIKERRQKDSKENKPGLDNRFKRSGSIWTPSGTGSVFTNWRDFPTQSPVCSRNDGISSRLDGITFSKLRAESVKLFGNAIVPQVALEIFKAIEEVEKQLINRV